MGDKTGAISVLEKFQNHFDIRFTSSSQSNAADTFLTNSFTKYVILHIQANNGQHTVATNNETYPLSATSILLFHRDQFFDHHLLIKHSNHFHFRSESEFDFHLMHEANLIRKKQKSEILETNMQ